MDQPEKNATAFRIVTLVALIGLLMFFRACSPSDLFDNDQPKTSSYMVDIVTNGHWVIQNEPDGRLMTKPPMVPWVSSMVIVATGTFDDWTFKSASVLAFIVTTVLVWRFGNQMGGGPASGVGFLAAVCWVCNPLAFKQMYNARPDMMLTMWMLIGVWCVYQQQRKWRDKTDSPIGMIALFWISIAGGLMTKGPPALIPLLWLVGMIWHSKGWRHCRPTVQPAFALMALLPPIFWLMSALDIRPDWISTLYSESADRLFGTGETGQRHDSPWYNIPVYVVYRLLPASLTFLLAVATLRFQDPTIRRKSLWAVWWVALITIIFIIPKGRRADYIHPAGLGIALTVAMLIVHLSAHRPVVARVYRGMLLLGGVLALGCALTSPLWVKSPGPLPIDTTTLEIVDNVRQVARVIVFVSCLALGLGGLVTIVCAIKRSFVRGSVAFTFATAGILGLYAGAFSSHAQGRDGDVLHVIADNARLIAKKEDLPVRCATINQVPIQALLGFNETFDDSTMSDMSNGGLLIAGPHHQTDVDRMFGERLQLLLRTSGLKGNDAFQIMLYRLTPTPRSAGDGGKSIPDSACK